MPSIGELALDCSSTDDEVVGRDGQLPPLKILTPSSSSASSVTGDSKRTLPELVGNPRKRETDVFSGAHDLARGVF